MCLYKYTQSKYPFVCLFMCSFVTISQPYSLFNSPMIMHSIFSKMAVTILELIFTCILIRFVSGRIMHYSSKHVSFSSIIAQLCIVGFGNNINETTLEGMASDLPSGAQCILKFGTALQYYRKLLDAVQMIKGAHGNILKNLNMYVRKLQKLTDRKVKKVEKAVKMMTRKQIDKPPKAIRNE